MQTLEWDNSLSVGVEEIDAQHRTWIDRFNKVVEAVSDRRGATEISKTLGFLVDYTEEHFGTEEARMAETGYPDMPAHRDRHDDIRLTLNGLVEDFREDGPTEELAGDVETFLGNWLIKHIREVDMKLGAFLAAQ
ncbi:MAG: hemerythrin family protein [Kiritimatiellae bacterium]|nr:hemerythrin family protein [Kiritimatiellia bacterium]